MRLAVVSDIHGNMDAFEKVLADIDQSRIDAIVCLGDTIGYGPEPNRVIREIQARKIPSVLGNHELAVNDPTYLKWFNSSARKSLQKTCKMLDDHSFRFISELQPSRLAHGCWCVHGFPPDSPLIYLFQVSGNKKKKALEQMTEKLCFIGHTHTLEIVGYDGERIYDKNLTQGINLLQENQKYIINVGSVGQPRDGDNTAKYVIWDAKDRTVEVRCIPYDIAAVVKKILAAGLPQEHGLRLW